MKTLAPSKALNSLRSRILVSALLIIVVVLPSIGIALNNAFKAQVEASLQEQLKAYFYSVLAVTEFENNELLMPEALLENQFNVINSGLYALISAAQETSEQNTSNSNNLIWFSDSFLGISISEPLPQPELGKSSYTQIQLNQETHFIFSFTVRFDISSNQDQAPSITIHIIKNLASIQQQQDAFSQQLWTWLLVLIFVLLLIQIFWLVWTLKPLARFTQELSDVQNGQAQQLSQHYPKELAAVAKQLNKLLATEQKQRKRYRNALSDLAHSLKTPLAVIQSQQDLSQSSQEQVGQIHRTIQHQLTRAQSAGNHAWHLGINIKPVAEKLIRTLYKIYPNIKLSLINDAAKDLVFRGDEGDLLEILGNLLDNACKAANSKVLFVIKKDNNCVYMSVEDDGKGISEMQRSDIMKRGKRADTYSKGHGIGLAIVQDLVDTYEGQLEISRSDELGGARFTLIFTD